MKTKGISFWEQNIERFVLGLALLVCVVLVAMQFLGETNAVQVAGKTLTPGDVDQALQEKAEEISGKFDETRDYKLTALSKPVFAALESRLNTPVIPDRKLAAWEPKSRLIIGDVRVDSAFVQAIVPKPTDSRAVQFFDTIEPEIVDAVEGLKTVIGTAPPYDVTWAMPTARFDVAALLKQFRDGGPNGEVALLLAWYNNRVDFIDVKVERQEYVDGQWINDKVLDPLPGYFSFRTELKGKTIDHEVRNWALELAADPANRTQIIQPPFYGTLTDSWSPPGDADAPAKAIAPDDPAGELKALRDEYQRKLDNVNKRLKDLGCPETAPPEAEKPKTPPKTPKPTGGGGGGGAAPGGGIGESQGGGMGQGLRGGGKNSELDLAKCKSAWAAKKKFETQLAKLDAEIEKITGKAAEKPREVVDAVEEPETVIDIWTHDLDVKPGKTYRYRFTVEVYNPLFGRKLELIPAQQPLAEKFTISSEPSEWSEPITAQPPLRFFVTSVRPSDQAAMGMAMGQAIAEVYRFHNGRWWLESFPVTPGDRVGDLKAARGGGTEVDYGTDWFVLDVVPTLGSSKQDLDGGYGATLMLQSLSDPEKIEWRSPRADATSAERRQLSGSVKLAELGSSGVASNSGTRTGSDGSGSD